MKKILSTLAMLLVISLGSTTFVACSSDDDKEETKVDVTEILGSWEETHVKSGDKTTTEVVTTWTFKADKAATEHVEAFVTTSYTKKNKILDMTFGFTYEYNGKKVKLTSTDPSVKNPISYYDVEINGNKMRMGNEEGGYFNLTKK